jgi:hypothetical protein
LYAQDKILEKICRDLMRVLPYIERTLSMIRHAGSSSIICCDTL